MVSPQSLRRFHTLNSRYVSNTATSRKDVYNTWRSPGIKRHGCTSSCLLTVDAWRKLIGDDLRRHVKSIGYRLLLLLCVRKKWFHWRTPVSNSTFSYRGCTTLTRLCRVDLVEISYKSRQNRYWISDFLCGLNQRRVAIHCFWGSGRGDV